MKICDIKCIDSPSVKMGMRANFWQIGTNDNLLN